jgi:hypothetical protein
MRIALWLAIVAQFGLILASLILTALSMPPGASLAEGLAGPLAFAVLTVTFPTVGAICLLRRPSQPVGWLLSVVALGWTLANAAGGYAKYARSGTGPVTLPGVEWALWLTGGSWPIIVSQGVLLFLVLLFPTGSLISRSWRPVAWLVVGWTALSAIAAAFASGPLEDILDLGIANPAAAPGEAGAVLQAVNGWLLYGFLVLYAVAAYGLVLRFRRSSGAERQQIKWIAAVAPIGVVLLAVMYGAVAVLGAGSLSSGSQAVDGPALLLVIGGFSSLGLLPVAIGVAILRHRLYDIDLLINRTLVYGALTATLAAAYVGAIALFQVALQSFTQESQLAVAASTLVVAALFQPLRARIQRAVDRRFFRRKYDAQRTVEAFRSRLRDEVDLSRLTDELEALVKDSLQPASVRVWLRSEGNSS